MGKIRTALPKADFRCSSHMTAQWSTARKRVMPTLFAADVGPITRVPSSSPAWFCPCGEGGVAWAGNTPGMVRAEEPAILYPSTATLPYPSVSF